MELVPPLTDPPKPRYRLNVGLLVALAIALGLWMVAIEVALSVYRRVA